jgi:hypothetical protein
MAGYGYGGFGGAPGGFGGGNIQQGFEQERIGYGPQGYVVFVVLSDKFTPLLLQIRRVRTGDTDQSKSLYRSNVCRTRKRIHTNGWWWISNGRWWLWPTIFLNSLSLSFYLSRTIKERFQSEYLLTVDARSYPSKTLLSPLY